MSRRAWHPDHPRWQGRVYRNTQPCLRRGLSGAWKFLALDRGPEAVCGVNRVNTEATRCAALSGWGMRWEHRKQLGATSRGKGPTRSAKERDVMWSRGHLGGFPGHSAARSACGRGKAGVTAISRTRHFRLRKKRHGFWGSRGALPLLWEAVTCSTYTTTRMSPWIQSQAPPGGPGLTLAPHRHPHWPNHTF